MCAVMNLNRLSLVSEQMLKSSSSRHNGNPDPGPIGPDPNGPDPCRIPMHIHVTDNRSGILTTGYLLFVHIRAYFLDLKLPEV